jgi:hypothetical protein
LLEHAIFPIVCHAPASASQLSWNQSICVSSEYRLAAWVDYIGCSSTISIIVFGIR